MWYVRSFSAVLSCVVQAIAVNVICVCMWVFGSAGKIFAWRLAQTNWISGVQAFLPPAKIIRYGEVFNNNGPAIIIANHQADVDWWYIWLLALDQGQAHKIKIILKDTLAKLPIFGWAMYLLGFIFLKRNWDQDKVHLYKKLNVFAEENFPVMLLIFPEGTTVNKLAMQKSKDFAKKTDRPSLNLLLLPRTTGFAACIEALQASETYIYDLTIAFEGYSGEIPSYEIGYEREKDKKVPNFSKLVSGINSEVHIDVCKFKASEIENPEKWLDERWSRKEKLLEHFIKNQQFPEDLGSRTISSVQGSWSSVIFLWTVVILAGVFLPLALMLLIPYSVIFMFSYTYLMWTEYSHGLLSREQKSNFSRTAVQISFLISAILFAVVIVSAWIFSLYSFIQSIYS